MKELSIEGKATRYEQAIKVAKSKIKNDKDHVLYEDDVIEIFPELKESEDERIRKALKEYFINSFQNNGVAAILGVHIKDILIWLEKQGEQKPVDFSDLRTWKYIVDAVWTEKEGIGQYLDSPFTEEVAKKLQKRFGHIEQSKQEWSEEDEQMLNDIIHAFTHCWTPSSKQIAWLKSISYKPNKDLSDALCKELENKYNEGKAIGIELGKEEIRKQLQQEWSEEDEEILKDGINLLSNECSERGIRLRNWLKSLRPQNRWKPSKEQMLALNIAIEMEDCDILKSLYQDLLKLREE